MAEGNKKEAADVLSSCYKMRFTDDISHKGDKGKFVGAYKKIQLYEWTIDVRRY